jgi:hypothetical protein
MGGNDVRSDGHFGELASSDAMTGVYEVYVFRAESLHRKPRPPARIRALTESGIAAVSRRFRFGCDRKPPG